jgi:hypothetical protein
MDKLVDIQDNIFSCRPYELKENDEWKEFAQTAATTFGLRNGSSAFGVRDGTSC